MEISLRAQSMPESPIRKLARYADAAKLAVTLAQGWNWIAYTPLTTMTIDEALAAASPQPGDIVKSQTAVAIYDQNGWEGTLTALEGGRGYMYYSVDGATKSFLYPTGATAQARSMSLRAARRAPDAPSIFTPVSPTLYPPWLTPARWPPLSTASVAVPPVPARTASTTSSLPAREPVSP